jgi:ubiquinone/menaquinone biosynthesis C-methylase UbiE
VTFTGTRARARAYVYSSPTIDRLRRSFDVVLFAGTLDHFVEPAVALAEAVRVLRADGTIAVYLGHKRPDAPKPAVSHDWYEALEVPAGASDRFHMERFGPGEATALFARAGLEVCDQEDHRVDEWRSYHFYRLRPPA